MMGALFLQQIYGPKPDPQEQVAQQDAENGEAGNEGADNSEDSAVVQDETAADQDAADGSDDSAPVDSDQPGSEEQGAETDSGLQAEEAEDEFVKIGSLNDAATDRYLITVNKKGGTIHRVELNVRDEKGRFRYRDLTHEGGYLGSTNYQLTTNGLEVLAVGSQTPADRAGLKPGDVLVSLGGEPIVGDEIEVWLDNNTKPGDSLELGIQRDGQPETLTAQLTHKPISILRPEGDRVDPDFEYPESFLISLIKPLEERDKKWPEIDPGMVEGQWEITEASTAQLVELKYTVPASKLEEHGIAGPITVYKRFSLPQVDPESPNKIDARSFHINLDVEIRNDSDQPASLAYQLDGPTGTTAETWWFANKIHGRQTALFYIAGARDIVGSTEADSYIFYGCPELVKGANKTPRESFWICDPLADSDTEQQLRFIGVDSHYFNVSLLPVTDGEFLNVDSASGFPVTNRNVLPKIPKNARLQKLVDCTFQMVKSIEVPAGGKYNQSFEVFCGPKDPDLLDDYGLSDTRTFGWFAWFSMILLKVLHFFYWITFKTSYGLAIIMLTVVVRSIMIPFSRKAAINAQMMQHLAPQMKEIAEKYKDDMEKRATAQRELYKKYNFNPFGGCLMMFVQLPIFYGLYKALNVDIALRDKPFIPGMEWCGNLAAPDQLLYWKDWMPGWLADETGYLGPYLNILPLATMVLFIVQQRLFTPPATDDQQKMMQKVMTFMMLFMGIMFFKVPAGLCIYFITSSLWGIVERKLLPKPQLDTEKLESMGTVATMKAVDKRQARKEERAEQARLSELEERKQRNLERKKRLKKRRGE